MPVDDLQAQYDALLESQKWAHAILSILVEQEGGVVKIDKATLENYDLGGTVQVYEDAESDSYVIEVIENV